MPSFLEKAKNLARKTGSAASLASKRAQLNVRITMLNGNISRRVKQFGVEVYDTVAPLVNTSEFYTIDDDPCLDSMKPVLLLSTREVAAIEKSITQLEIEVARAEGDRRGKASGVSSSSNWKEGLRNVGSTIKAGGGEAKLRTELSLKRSEIVMNKEIMGLKLYDVLENLENERNILPQDRELRTIYDGCRKDVEILREKIEDKKRALRALDLAAEEHELLMR
mmetsp:Transcript_7242/g.10373  ORF Transcript_7242/g.10373 Transcript_7242/m.10373 type:complete len:223 (-) Transcript_7242:764-1432(-)|eukprot:CAMPEP_0184867812 /NCGR_PEP_ID=MMETSP0580-20130426/27822_1 /TAXON_ID=1118495 /ORGANISM="Dactyliosolen fragilissimus" /LENGTH=222 /DNA_ID=CAMNT_0027368275 /DNA_START=41 /DNA_END=709 /DNA_ORIENTATION=-